MTLKKVYTAWMAITNKRITGNRGEELVATFLMKQGFSIIERNHWRKWGEIDIVAKNLKDRYTHFIEVKTVIREFNRTLDITEEYSPADNMTFKKLKRFSKIIQTYVSENNLDESDWQADVALVYLDKNSENFKIEMLEDIDL